MDWWDDEPELLGATLGMLAAWDGNQPIFHHDKISAMSSTQAMKDEPQLDYPGLDNIPVQRYRSGRSINVSRERRRQEAFYLRKKVDALQHELSERQRRRDEMLQPHYRDSKKLKLATVAPIWETMARRQFQSRKRSEQLNAELKTMVSVQARIAEDLQRVLQRALQERAVSTTKQLSFDVSLRMTQDEQIARLENLCSQSESVFEASTKFKEGPLQFFDIQIVEDKGLEKVIEVRGGNVVPFSVQRVEETMWTFFQNDSPPSDDDEVYEKTHEATDNTMITTFTSTSSMGGSVRGTLRGKWVLKRLPVDGGKQCLLVSHTLSEPEGFNNELDRAIIDEDSWVRLVDAGELGHDLRGSPLTAIQHVQRTRITFHQKNGQPDLQRVEELTALYMKQIEDESNWVQIALENALLKGPVD